MVAHRSPKPLVWVRVLLPLPSKTGLNFNSVFIFYKLNLKELIYISKFIYTIILFAIFICTFFIPLISTNQNYTTTEYGEIIYLNNKSDFAWPIPGYTYISSPFGKREAPTGGASTYHKGTDIPAPEGTALVATIDGEITFTGFLGGGGYTITISKDNFKISYCHVSPNYIVSVGDQVKTGQIIGHVGPKYVYGVPGNIYTDEKGNPTNGATTGCHLHIGFRLDNTYVNPLDFLL